MIELLIVIVVIGVLAGVLLAVGAHALHGQRATTTRNIMRTVEMAIDQFASQNPFQRVYDNPKLRDDAGASSLVVGRTFGPYPPYQLHGCLGSVADPGCVRGALEPSEALWGSNYTLSNRLIRDFDGDVAADYVDLEEDGSGDDQQNNDIRALYTYLKIYSPGVLAQVPESAIKPLVPGTPEYVNPTGAGTVPGTEGLVDVFGIYDAWGVPLDYFLQVKLEYKLGPDGVNARWVVTDRVPVLRSRGRSAEQVAAADKAFADGDETLLEPQRWIYSTPLAPPAANVDALSGGFLSSNAQDNGWARAVGENENYGYVPEQ